VKKNPKRERGPKCLVWRQSRENCGVGPRLRFGFSFALEVISEKSGGALSEISRLLHESNRKIGISLEEIPICLPEIHKSARKICISLADLCISPREIPIFLREIHIFSEDSGHVEGVEGGFFGGVLDKRRLILRKLRLFRELLPMCATRLRLRFEILTRPSKAQRSFKTRL